MAIRFELINKDELPMNKTQVNYKKMVGMTLKFRDTIIDKIYNIKILEYIPKKKDASFLIEYIYLENYPEYKEVITREITCIKLVKLYQLYNIIPSINDWERVNDYWVGKLKNNNNFKFSTNDKTTEYNILHSNWCHQDKYIMTQDLNGLGKWKIHRAIIFNCNKEESNNNELIIDHIDNNPSNNKMDNLRLATFQDNSKNVQNKNYKNNELTCLREENGTYRSSFCHNEKRIQTKRKKDKQEAELDNLIAQRYLGCMHNNDQFYRIEKLPEERIKEVTDWLDRQINGVKLEVKTGTEHQYAKKLICIHKSGLISEAMNLRDMAKYLNTTDSLINKILKSGKPYEVINGRNAKHLEGIQIIEIPKENA